MVTAELARQAAAAVGVRTCWPWDTAATLPSARRRKALQRPQGEETGGGILWRLPAYSLFLLAYCGLSCFSVVKATDLHPVNPGSTPAGNDMSHCWQQEGHPTKIAPVF